jgi:hypothetical protein
MSALLDGTEFVRKIQRIMRHWIVGIFALLIFAIMMALRPSISSITTRTVMAAAAFGFAGIGLYAFTRIGVARRGGEKRQQ